MQWIRLIHCQLQTYCWFSCKRKEREKSLFTQSMKGDHSESLQRVNNIWALLYLQKNKKWHLNERNELTAICNVFYRHVFLASQSGLSIYHIWLSLQRFNSSAASPCLTTVIPRCSAAREWFSTASTEVTKPYVLQHLLFNITITT